MFGVSWSTLRFSEGNLMATQAFGSTSECIVALVAGIQNEGLDV